MTFEKKNQVILLVLQNINSAMTTPRGDLLAAFKITFASEMMLVLSKLDDLPLSQTMPILEVNRAKSFTEQLWLMIDIPLNLCLIYIKITCPLSSHFVRVHEK